MITLWTSLIGHVTVVSGLTYNGCRRLDSIRRRTTILHPLQCVQTALPTNIGLPSRPQTSEDRDDHWWHMLSYLRESKRSR